MPRTEVIPRAAMTRYNTHIDVRYWEDSYGNSTSLKSAAGSPAESVEQKLRRLEAQWKADTRFLSDANQIIDHPAFQEIVALGKDVLPFLLKDLEGQASLWVWALPEIAGENPVPASDAGNIRKMSDAWLKWGRAQGLR